jgi:hypothetical protein
MRKYRVISCKTSSQLESELNRLAAENWRPVGLSSETHTGIIAILERERPYTPSGGPNEIAAGN